MKSSDGDANKYAKHKSFDDICNYFMGCALLPGKISSNEYKSKLDAILAS